MQICVHVLGIFTAGFTGFHVRASAELFFSVNYPEVRESSHHSMFYFRIAVIKELRRLSKLRGRVVLS